MPSLRERISQAASALFGRQTRSVPLPYESLYHSQGMAPLFKPAESLRVYGDNPWLGRAVDRIAREIARTQFRLQTENRKGEIEIVQKHEALETLKRPQRTKSGKSLLSGMQLKLINRYHLCLEGQAFWLLQERRKINGAPTKIDRQRSTNRILQRGIA